MLISLAILFLLGGGSQNLDLLPLPEDFNKQIKSIIEDEEQRKEVNALVKQSQKDAELYNASIEAMVNNGLELYADYSKEAKDFEELVHFYIKERQKVQKDLVDTHFKLAELITREQWQEIYQLNNED